MQVKKFEARSVKEAIEMIKHQLGPDAIILSVRDNKKSFGLVGDGSVEVTAAASDETLNRRSYAQSRMRDSDREKMNNSSAKVQKEVINKFVEKYQQKQNSGLKNIPVRGQRYIDIADEPQVGRTTPEQLVRAGALPAKDVDDFKITHLQAELSQLKQMLTQFQQQNEVKKEVAAGQMVSYPHELHPLFLKLQQSGIQIDKINTIFESLQQDWGPHRLKNGQAAESWVARYLMDRISMNGQELSRGVHVFMGPSGSGKTSMLVKLAAQKAIKEKKKVAILTADTFKIGAFDQMKIFAQILNVPLAVIKSGKEWAQIQSFISKMDYVFLDMPGKSLRNSEEILGMQNLLPTLALPVHKHLVLSAQGQSEDMKEMARRFSVLGYEDLFLTGLDLTQKAGNIFNLIDDTKLAVRYFGIGARVPDDIEVATSERIIDLIFKISDEQKERDLTQGTRGSRGANL